jgi:hypothetical protein
MKTLFTVLIVLVLAMAIVTPVVAGGGQVQHQGENGQGAADTTYTVACKIVTSDSRTDERTIYVHVTSR